MYRFFRVMAICLLPSVCWGEAVKGIINPTTGRIDYITVLTSSTLPLGSTQYIWNTTLQQEASFYVRTGTVTGNLYVGDRIGIGVSSPSGKMDINGGSLTIRGANSGLRVTGLSGLSSIATDADGNFIPGSGGGSSDNLGSHIATKQVSMGDFPIVNISSLVVSGPTVSIRGVPYFFPLTAPVTNQILVGQSSGTLAWRNWGPTRYYVVDANGQGDFTTVKAAANATSGGNEQYFIFVNAGTYNEVDIPLRSNVTWFGAGRQKVTIGSIALSGTGTFVATAAITNVEFHNMKINQSGSPGFIAIYNPPGLGTSSDNYAFSCNIGPCTSATTGFEFYNCEAVPGGATMFGGKILQGGQNTGTFYGIQYEPTSVPFTTTFIASNLIGNITSNDGGSISYLNSVLNSMTYSNSNWPGTRWVNSVVTGNLNLGIAPIGAASQITNTAILGTLTLPYGGTLPSVRNSFAAGVVNSTMANYTFNLLPARYQAGTGNITPSITRAAVSQSSNIAQWEDSSGNILAHVGWNGRFGVGNSSATSSIDVNNGSITVRGTNAGISASSYTVNGRAVMVSSFTPASPIDCSDCVTYYTTGTITANTTRTFNASDYGAVSIHAPKCGMVEQSNTSANTVRIKSLSGLPGSFTCYNSDLTQTQGYWVEFWLKY